MTTSTLVVIVLLWVYVFGVRTIESEKEVSEQNHYVGSMSELWKTFKDSMQGVEHLLTEGAKGTEQTTIEMIATTTPSVSPRASIVELH